MSQPSILDELRMLLTDEQLVMFLACYAGNDFRFEKHDNGPSFKQLVRVIGPEAASRLRRHFAGERVYIPRGSDAENRARRDAEIRSRIALGESNASIARSFRISERWVRQIAARMRGAKANESVGSPA